ncbi:MAG TPA: G8 domain-containing protein [Bacteroidia bacterium]|jgi:hypothetical protein|nr:G8 domain-containing protein [Bacteroidia bacterium]
MPTIKSITRSVLFLFSFQLTHSVYAQTAVGTITSTQVTNGSFETPALATGTYQYSPTGSGWSFSGTAGISYNGSAFTNCTQNTSVGNQVLLLQRDGNALRTFTTATTGAYRLSIKAAQRGCQNTSPQTIRVYVDGTFLSEITPTSSNYQTYTTAVLWLIGGNHDLHLLGKSLLDNTAFVDDVRWEAIPRWSQPSTWQGGAVPTSSSMTMIPAGLIVAMDVMNCTSGMVHINGTLTVPWNTNFGLSTEFIHVDNGGLLEIGQSGRKYYGSGKVTLVGNDPNSTLGGIDMGSKGIGIMSGGRLELHGTYQPSWTKLNATANSGSNTITVNDVVSWKVGDRIVIASTDFDMNKAEKRTITAVNSSFTYTLDSTLANKHFGQLQSYSSTNGQSWTVDERAEVGLLSRNLIIEGDASSSTSQFGGHIMVMQGGVAHVEDIELNRMGQITNKARYPFHWHQVGDASGQYFTNNSVHNTYNRGITIHGTNNTIVSYNVFYDNIGHAVFMEDGTETGNSIDHNLGLVTRRPNAAFKFLPSDFNLDRNASGPSTFWITNVSNKVQFNNAGGSDGSGFWFAFIQNGNIPAGYIDYNTAHSSVHGWLIGMAPRPGNDTADLNNDYQPSLSPTVTGLTVYKNKLGIYSRIGADLTSSTYVNMKVADNWEGDANTWVSEIKNSLWVGASQNYEPIPITPQSKLSISSSEEEQVVGHVLYDGPCKISDSHFAGFDRPKFSLFDQWGANFKYHGHSLKNTTVASGSYNVQFRKRYDSPTWFNASITDIDGKFTGTAMTSIVMDHPIMIDNTCQRITPRINATAPCPAGTTCLNGVESKKRYCYVELRSSDEIYPVPNGREYNRRQLSQLLRSDGKTWLETRKEVEGVSISLMVNGIYQYKYLYHERIPVSTRLDFYSMNAGEWAIIEIANIPSSAIAYSGLMNGFSGGTGFSELRRVSTLAELQAGYGSAAAYIGTSMFVKFQAPRGSDFLNRGCIGSLFLCLYGNCGPGANIPFADTDGDGATDITETMGHPFFVRNMNDVNDMSFDFNDGNGDKWFFSNQFVNDGFTPGGVWILHATGTDTYIQRDGLNIDGDKMKYIEMRAVNQVPGDYELAWKTADQDYFDANKRVFVSNTDPNFWKAFRFKVGDNPLWKGKRITSLRIRSVSNIASSTLFDWIKAKNTWVYDLNKTAAASTLQRFDGGNNEANEIRTTFNTILGQADNSWSFDLIDWNNDGYTDIAAVKKYTTGSGYAEIHVMDGKTDYQTFLLQSSTAMSYLNGNDHAFIGDYNGDKKPDIWFITHNVTGSNKTEVHIIDGNNLQSFLLHDATALEILPNTIDDFGVYDYDGDKLVDLWYIKKNGTSGKTEVHILKNTGNPTTMFDGFSLHTATTLSATNANWSFDVADYNRDGMVDVIGVDRIGTGGKVNLNILDGVTGFQSYLLQTTTNMPSGTASHVYMVDDGTRATGLGYSGAGAFATTIEDKSEFNMQSKEIEVYPNPATDEIMISLGEYAGNELELIIEYVNTGAIVLKRNYKVSDSLLKLSVENLNAGVYIIQLNIQGSVVQKKLVIAK